MKKLSARFRATKGLALVCIILALLLTAPLQAQEKRALVIGNASYRIGALKNPVNDARSVANTLRLRQLGFQVTERHNRNLDQMEHSIRHFSASIKPGSVAMIYYAGHGMQYGGENYLIPIGMDAQFEDQLPRKAIGASFILDKLSHNSNGLNIVVLDACRDNPLQKRYRSQTRGLARIDITPPNTFTLLATGPNQVAQDNPRGNNGLFTKYLVQQMKRPGLELAAMVRETRKQVMAASGNKQVPYSTDSLTQRFCFAGCDMAGNAVSNTPVTVAAAPQASTRPNTSFSNQHRHNGRSHIHPLPASGKNHQHNGAKPVVVQPVRVQPATQPTTARRDPREPMMVRIRGGSFTMGSPASESDRYNDEKPHTVRVGDFYLGKTEVTNTEYARCVTAGSCKPAKQYNGFTGGSQPVVGVSWDDAMSYANWLSGISDKRYGLPTEAQWEYAARAGTQTAYYWGNQVGKNQANCAGCGSQWDYKSSAPVGRFAANRFGLHDMLGNVYEWACSEYDENYVGGKEQRCAAPGSRAERALRGGSWYSGPWNVRSANRDRNTPTNRYNYVGFRLSRTP